jgi:DNA-binding GntR family transcriptional regulator
MEQAYEELKRRIITLELPPGKRIDEYEMARELELSRTPVREALFQLLAERLVTMGHGSGFIVQTLALSDVVDFFEAQFVISKATSRLAAIHATPSDIKAMAKKADKVRNAIKRRDYLAITHANSEFHRCESIAAHSQQLQLIGESLTEQGQRLAYLCFGGTNDRWEGLDDHFSKVLAQHDQLLSAYDAHVPSTAEATATAHVELFRQRVQSYLGASDAEGLTFAELTGDRTLV